MLYVSDDGARATVDMATSGDGVTWDRRGTTLGPRQVEDAFARVRGPSAIRLHDGRVRLWYSAHGLGDAADSCRLWSADLATEP
jgi:hypothetical protein